jgi:hypothetical protein
MRRHADSPQADFLFGHVFLRAFAQTHPAHEHQPAATRTKEFVFGRFYPNR